VKMPALYYLTFFIEIVVGIIGLVRYKKVVQPLRLLVALVLFWFFAGILEYVTAQRNIHNMWIVQINNVIEMIVFTWIYYFWRTSKRNGLILVSLLLLFLLVWIVGKFTFEPITGADETTWALSRLIQMFVGVALLIGILKNDKAPLWFHDPKFLVTSSFVIYAAGAFFLFSLYTPLLRSSRELLRVVYQINWMLTIVSHILFALAFFCKPEPATEVGSGIAAKTIEPS
jgi:hypothetical protein